MSPGFANREDLGRICVEDPRYEEMSQGTASKSCRYAICSCLPEVDFSPRLLEFGRDL